EAQVRQQVELPPRSVLARQPLGQEQHQFVQARWYWHRLLHPVDTACEVGGVDVQSHRAGEGHILRGRYRRRQGQGGGRGTLGDLGGCGSGDEQGNREGRGEAGYLHPPTLAVTGSIRNRLQRGRLCERR